MKIPRLWILIERGSGFPLTRDFAEFKIVVLNNSPVYEAGLIGDKI